VSPHRVYSPDTSFCIQCHCLGRGRGTTTSPVSSPRCKVAKTQLLLHPPTHQPCCSASQPRPYVHQSFDLWLLPGIPQFCWVRVETSRAGLLQHTQSDRVDCLRPLDMHTGAFVGAPSPVLQHQRGLRRADLSHYSNHQAPSPSPGRRTAAIGSDGAASNSR
jgi:hypothetical protein